MAGWLAGWLVALTVRKSPDSETAIVLGTRPLSSSSSWVCRDVRVCCGVTDRNVEMLLELSGKLMHWRTKKWKEDCFVA